jgi:ABC-type lipoprotein export system ATPase subunit
MLPLAPVVKNNMRLRKRAKGLLGMVSLAERMEHRPTQMSGGEQQRVAIARALINNPSIVLADEPTGNVDTKTSEEIIALMQRLNQERGQTFIVVTHDTSITRIASRVIHLRDGRVAREDRMNAGGQPNLVPAS